MSDIRILAEADYIIQTGATVRETAKQFGISKSTVHKDMQERLRYINHILYDKVKGILYDHKKERHLRGGEATRKKYAKKN